MEGCKNVYIRHDSISCLIGLNSEDENKRNIWNKRKIIHTKKKLSEETILLLKGFWLKKDNQTSSPSGTRQNALEQTRVQVWTCLRYVFRCGHACVSPTITFYFVSVKSLLAVLPSLVVLFVKFT